MIDELSGWKRSAAQIGLVSLGMQNFSETIIRHALRGLPFDEATLANIKERCLIDFKNADVTGLKIEDEATLLRDAIENFDKMMDLAIANARKSH